MKIILNSKQFARSMALGSMIDIEDFPEKMKSGEKQQSSQGYQLYVVRPLTVLNFEGFNGDPEQLRSVSVSITNKDKQEPIEAGQFYAPEGEVVLNIYAIAGKQWLVAECSRLVPWMEAEVEAEDVTTELTAFQSVRKMGWTKATRERARQDFDALLAPFKYKDEENGELMVSIPVEDSVDVDKQIKSLFPKMHHPAGLVWGVFLSGLAEHAENRLRRTVEHGTENTGSNHG